MTELLWVVPALPYAGFMLLALFGRRFPQPVCGLVGSSTVGLSLLVTIFGGIPFLAEPSRPVVQNLWTWMSVEGFMPLIGLRLDALSLVFIFVITLVGFLIHVYSTGFMSGEEGYSRFFAYMNLFVGSMLVLVLADNLLLLYLGWEGVGLCSYLLIGFWYRDPANGRAARKAFVVTRVGDAAFAVGLFLLYSQLGTLDIQELSLRAAVQWASGSPVAVATAALLLAGAVGKSAQLPLQVWLPDAMAGPTPVSALIHAATMVTAGVYLIARTHGLFLLAPQVMTAVALIGAATMLLAGLSALVQTDIKRVLAYSTISQIGYMFLALGVGAWSAAVFHFMTHAFFKALLFLCAGAVITALHHEHDIFKMGGLRQRLPLVFWCTVVGAASLSAFPLFTAGYYSKDLILLEVWSASSGIPWLWLAGLAGAAVTGLYSFRLVFTIFLGQQKGVVTRLPGRVMMIPLVVLAFLSVAAGFVEIPRTLWPVHLFSELLGRVLPAAAGRDAGVSGEVLLQAAAAAASVSGLFLAYILYVMKPDLTAMISGYRASGIVTGFLKSGWGFDWVYERVIVRPLVWLARANREDIFDLFFLGAAWSGRGLHRVLSMSQSGRVRWYAMGIGLGAVAILAAVILI